eukprot:TRINITY_DN54330_c0_g1_i1.p1 TRINITY_DN54330_c0_g1~~TRINITY_DN54330_c0_g1_i1.p1  ORF type:complete len:680 (+),score=132.54 TRINITY_DN54330_c0_g1_i1:69-2042(+)
MATDRRARIASAAKAVLALSFLASWREVVASAEDGSCQVSGTCTAARLDTTNVWTIDDDIKYNCPAIFGEQYGRPVTKFGLKIFSTLFNLADKATTILFGRELLTQGWADEYTASMYFFVVRATMGMYKTRDPSFVNVPTMVASNESLKVGNIYAPHFDVDGYPNFLWLEKYIPGIFIKPFYIPAMTCFYNGLRELPFEDELDQSDFNTWDAVLKSGKYASKKDWLLGFYTNAKTFDGGVTWPDQRVDYTALFRKGDDWDDALETAMVFDGIGAHRVVQVDREVGGEVLPFAVKLNAFAAFEVRPGFGKYGGDLYFTKDGRLAMLETPSGQLVRPGDKDWQYWKFVFRSSLVTVITLCDHLHFTHFKASNTIARAIRMGLPPDHAYRRLLSIFSFGAIFVNLQAQFTLTGTDMMLNRATPFKDFAVFSEAVPRMLPDITDMPGITQLLNDTAFDELPEILKKTPFFDDGRLIMKAFFKLILGLEELLGSRICHGGLIRDPAMKHFIGVLSKQVDEAEYKAIAYDAEKLPCKIMWPRLASIMFTVTAWHSHVGFVGDYYADPDLLMMAWRDGERSGVPRQSMITSIINVFTSTRQPRLMDDYTHLFKGISDDATLTSLWRGLLEDLHNAKKLIDERNSKRKVRNIQMDPEVLESAVSK